MKGYTYCPYCGHKYRDNGEQYCGGCGKPVEKAPGIKDLVMEKLTNPFSWRWFERHEILCTLFLIGFVVVSSFALVIMAETKDNNKIIHNERIIGKFTDHQLNEFVIVTENSSYKTNSRTYYKYDINDTLDGSWSSLHLKEYYG